jgi:hypothetical protein
MRKYTRVSRSRSKSASKRKQSTTLTPLSTHRRALDPTLSDMPMEEIFDENCPSTEESISDTESEARFTRYMISRVLLTVVNHARTTEAKRLVDLLIESQTCEHCRNGRIVDEGAKSLYEMVSHFEKYPIPNPDFCTKVDKQPLSFSLPEDRAEILKHLEVRLTGLSNDSSTDKDGDTSTPKFDLHIGDKCCQESSLQTLNTSVSLDIDSAICLGFPLSMIKCAINLTTIPSRGRNMGSSAHVNLHGTPVHRLPHFRLGTFGNEVQFELFMMLPELHSHVKSTYVPDAVLKAWFNEVLIPASKCIPHQYRSQWSSNWDQEVAKCSAGREGKRVRDRGRIEKEAIPDDDDSKEISDLLHSRQMEVVQVVAPEFVKNFWNGITRRLDEAIAKDHSQLKLFKGYQLFCSDKNWKNTVFEQSGSLANLLEKMRRMVCQATS